MGYKNSEVLTNSCCKPKGVLRGNDAFLKESSAKNFKNWPAKILKFSQTISANRRGAKGERGVPALVVC